MIFTPASHGNHLWKFKIPEPTFTDVDLISLVYCLGTGILKLFHVPLMFRQG